jgi:hypothetical protein
MVIWRQRSCRSYQNGVLLFQDELLERKGEVGIFFPRIIGGNTFQKSKKCLLVRKKEEKKIIRPLFVFIWKDTGPKRTTNGWKRGILWRYVSIRAIIRLNIHSISYQSTVRVAGNFFFPNFVIWNIPHYLFLIVDNFVTHCSCGDRDSGQRRCAGNISIIFSALKKFLENCDPGPRIASYQSMLRANLDPQGGYSTHNTWSTVETYARKYPTLEWIERRKNWVLTANLLLSANGKRWKFFS